MYYLSRPILISPAIFSKYYITLFVELRHCLKGIENKEKNNLNCTIYYYKKKNFF